MAVKKLLVGFRDEIARMLPLAIQNLDNYHSNARYRASGVSLEYIIEDYQQLTTWQSWLQSDVLISNIEPVQVYLNVHVFPTSMSVLSRSRLWLYQDNAYEVADRCSDEEKKLLVLDFADKERQKFERLAAKFSKEQTEHLKYERTRIPETVRIEVWRRDQGKCAGCGSRENLEYDHIVPVSRGGSNTARNVELLCEACNRSKGDRIQ